MLNHPDLPGPADSASEATSGREGTDGGDDFPCDVGAQNRRRRGRAPVEQLTKRKRTRLKARGKSTRAMSLKILAKEYIWLWDVRHGVSISEIAIREGVSVPRVRFGVARARAQERVCPTEAATRPPRLIPLFPLGAFTPQSTCGHHRAIEPGSFLCCVVCHCSGIDDHPALQRDPVTDPVPEPKPPAAPAKVERETRKQRRQRIFGTSSLISAS